MQSDKAQATWFYDGLGWFETHRKQTIQAAGIIAAFALIVSYYFYSRGQKEDAAAAALSQLILTRGTPAEYIKFEADNRSTEAAPKALLMAGQTLFSEGKFPEAQAQFQKLRQEYRTSEFAGTAALGIATCLDAQGKVDEAIAAYSDVTRRSGDIAAIQAEFSLGRLYETKGDLDKATAHYDAVVQMAGNSNLGNEAYMRAGELRAAHPELVKPGQVVPPMNPGQ